MSSSRARRQRRDLLGEVEQLVGGVAHRRDDDDDVVTGLACVSTIRSATRLMRSASATDEPPYFALAPVSPDDPCGPDLDLEGDADYLNFFAATEGILPRNIDEYYKFDRVAAGLPARIETADKLLGRTLDVRLLLLLAKLSILDRDVAGFARWVGGVDWLLREHWEAAHPRAEGGDYSIRLGQLMALEDNAGVLLPLQYARLLELPREGPSPTATNWRRPAPSSRGRSWATASRRARERRPSRRKLVPQKTIEKILRDVDIEKVAKLSETLRGIPAALESIRKTTAEHVGYEKSIDLPKLDKLAREMAEFARGALVARDPTLAAPAPEEAAPTGEGEAAPSAAAPSAFASRADVDAALASALGYFESSEPTSPALLLIRQARVMLGKNLYEVMQLLAPSYADDARVFVGPDELVHGSGQDPGRGPQRRVRAGAARARARPAQPRWR